jgi:hypothetical protein
MPPQSERASHQRPYALLVRRPSSRPSDGPSSDSGSAGSESSGARAIQPDAAALVPAAAMRAATTAELNLTHASAKLMNTSVSSHSPRSTPERGNWKNAVKNRRELRCDLHRASVP